MVFTDWFYGGEWGIRFFSHKAPKDDHTAKGKQHLVNIMIHLKIALQTIDQFFDSMHGR